ncbi:DUF1338 domain-containing protein [Fulvivirgaceae bacterium BMA12]|uniref:2-oxoadipate dioxygenase/decarboxylase n=1 Tax=Agaribacillus aureus TaxID=3051825 RepID=A0ABT8LFT4_9BACT|nr:DUF1338 domain-containing protein [Fulvivirgaceae bacterium BMA12]
MDHEYLLGFLWEEYQKNTPSAGRIHKLLAEKGEKVVNDHIALRTVNLPPVSLDRIAEVLSDLGYAAKDDYDFPEKRLKARHFEREDKKGPKIFVSELILQNFSQQLQEQLTICFHQIPLGLLSTGAFIYSGRTWGTISYKTYLSLLKESEYAAWLYVYGFCVNHFTVDVGQLNTLDSLQKMNDFLKQNGFTLNQTGGEIKGSPAQLLEQSSIMADNKWIRFAEGTYEIPSCYYEFAKRYADADGKLFDGFIAKSADKIFESTNTKIP